MKPIRFTTHVEVPIEYLDMGKIEEELTIDNLAYNKQREMGYSTKDMQPYVSLYWLDSDGYVHLPRGYKNLPFTDAGLCAIEQDGLQVLLPEPATASWTFRRTLRPKQIPAAQALTDADERGELDKLLTLSCGGGKTCLALWYAAQKQAQTLIIVDSDFLAEQWRNQINKCLWVDKRRIGLIKADTFNVQPITIALLQTLRNRVEDLPREFFDSWGLVIFDECHVASAPQAARVLPCFPGNRLGLSATPDRLDGLGPVFQWHLNGLAPTYQDLSKDRQAAWCFKRLPRVVSENDEAKCWQAMRGKRDRMGKPVYALLRSRFDTFAAKSALWNSIILEDVERAVAKKRQTIVLGTRVEQLKLLHNEAFAKGIDSGVVVGEIKGDDRKTMLTKQVIFATATLAGKALDVPRLDTLFILYPSSDPNFLRQASGRIERAYAAKNEPVVMVYSHSYNRRLLQKENQMRSAILSLDPRATVRVMA